MSISIAARDVSHAYGKIEALNNISMEACEGDFVGLLGPNGSGKSTLLRILAGILHQASGEVFLKGKKINAYDGKGKARCLAYVPQSLSYDFPFTVFDFVKMGRSPYLSFLGISGKEDDQAVEKALLRTDCGSLADRLITSLSGGERQRVILAQAFAQEAEILILDEPVSFLDIGHQLQVLDVLKNETRSGRTVIASFHDLNLASHFATQILLLSSGRMVACGKPLDVLKPEFIERAYGISADVVCLPDFENPIIVARGRR